MNPFELYDYLQDKTAAENLEFDTVDELYEYMAKEFDNGLKDYDRQGT